MTTPWADSRDGDPPLKDTVLDSKMSRVTPSVVIENGKPPSFSLTILLSVSDGLKASDGSVGVQDIPV